MIWARRHIVIVGILLAMIPNSGHGANILSAILRFCKSEGPQPRVTHIGLPAKELTEANRPYDDILGEGWDPAILMRRALDHLKRLPNLTAYQKAERFGSLIKVIRARKVGEYGWNSYYFEVNGDHYFYGREDHIVRIDSGGFLYIVEKGSLPPEIEVPKYSPSRSLDYMKNITSLVRWYQIWPEKN